MTVRNLSVADVNALKGAALAEAARDLDIPGRSKMKAADLRAAIIDAIGQPVSAETNHTPPLPVIMTDEEIAASAEDDDEPDVWTVVPNRRDRRAHRRRIRSMVRQGRRSAEESAERFRASIEAGMRGKFYGNRHADTALYV